jgi:hypothetical protein
MAKDNTAPTAPKTPAFDWADLGTVEDVQQGYVRGPRVDIESEVPEVLRKRVEDNYTRYMAQEPNDKGERTPVWVRQPCGTEQRAKEFARLVKRYGKYRKAGEITVRAVPDAKDNTAVRFCAKPKETKDRTANRLPGSESRDA